ncbi:2718_t:CDS:2 [Cetraspora pellucida]|uniref:2718_t:CDS:1 n=1 Tax=Cetraspora pellucida TaxID=1433469 RepID=A0ACA9NHY6_9GLOM|nr:2718_t:CDS:2 [Cetraspora pellucida]
MDQQQQFNKLKEIVQKGHNKTTYYEKIITILQISLELEKEDQQKSYQDLIDILTEKNIIPKGYIDSIKEIKENSEEKLTKTLEFKLMNSTQTFEEIVDEIQEQIQEKLKQAKAFQESIILNRDHLIVKQHTWIEWNIVYIRDIINKRRATASITKEDLDEYFTEAIKLKWTIDYQDSTDQIATLISKAKTY